MSGIWTKTEAGWRAALSRKFDNEVELHDLVEGKSGFSCKSESV